MFDFPRKFRVYVSAPAGKIDRSPVGMGAAALKAAGCEVTLTPHLFDGGQLPHLSASDRDRAEDINSAVRDGAEIIWCARGGCGCLRILDKIDWEMIGSRGVAIAGFSDVTALHWAMAKFGMDSILAAPMMKYLGTAGDGLTCKTLSDALSGRPVSLRLEALKKGFASGHPLPGNIAVAASMCGTPFFPDTAGKVLVLEEVGEAPYRIDRMLTQLRLAGTFDRCAGIVFGRFTGCGEASDVEAVLKDFSDSVSCPVFTGLPFGHELPFFSLSGRQLICVSPR